MTLPHTPLHRFRAFGGIVGGAPDVRRFNTPSGVRWCLTEDPQHVVPFGMLPGWLLVWVGSTWAWVPVKGETK